MTTAPAWLEPALQARIDLMIDTMGGLPEDWPIVMTTLTEPAEDATDADRDRWERSCDHCGRYCPTGEDFFTGTSSKDYEGVQVIITFGVCPDCRSD